MGTSSARRSEVCPLPATRHGSAPTLGTANKGLDRKQLTLGVTLPRHSIGKMEPAMALLGERSRSDAENSKLGRLVSGAWTVGIAPRQDGAGPEVDIEVIRTPTDEERLVVSAEKAFSGADALRAKDYAPPVIEIRLRRELRTLWNTGRIRTGELAALHARYLYLPRLRSPGILYDGLSQITHSLADDTFWLAEGYDDATGDFVGLAGPGDALRRGVDGDMYIVRPEIARDQRVREQEAEKSVHARDEGPAGPDGSTTTGTSRPAPQGAAPDAAPAERLRNASYTARFALDAGDIEGSFTQIAEEVIAHLLEAGPDLLDVSVTIRAEHGDGFDDSVARAVSENARTLGADDSHFEQG